MAKEVPVYLFTGFLDAGKTKFAQETLQDKSFNNGDRILLVCRFDNLGKGASGAAVECMNYVLGVAPETGLEL